MAKSNIKSASSKPEKKPTKSVSKKPFKPNRPKSAAKNISPAAVDKQHVQILKKPTKLKKTKVGSDSQKAILSKPIVADRGSKYIIFIYRNLHNLIL